MVKIGKKKNLSVIIPSAGKEEKWWEGKLL